jgi:hypothetical protein
MLFAYVERMSEKLWNDAACTHKRIEHSLTTQQTKRSLFVLLPKLPNGIGISKSSDNVGAKSSCATCVSGFLLVTFHCFVRSMLVSFRFEQKI